MTEEQANTINLQEERDARSKKESGFEGGSHPDDANTIVIKELNDFGLGKRFVKAYPGTLFHCWDSGHWKVWDGKRFHNNKNEVEHRAWKLIDEIEKEFTSLTPMQKIRDEKDKSITQETIDYFLQNVKKDNKIKATINMAARDIQIKAEEKDFDTHPHLLNCGNGIINLKSGELCGHDPLYKMSHITEVAYYPEAKSEKWQQFLKEVTKGDAELEAYLQMAFGYALTGETKEQVFFIMYGPKGSNGKSTLLNLIHKALGSYATKTPMDTLLRKKHDGISNDLARLKGARMVSAVEANQDRALDEAKIKQMTGGDTVTARFLYNEFFEYTPEFKLFMAVNDLPSITSGDEAMFRRIRVIPFNACFKGEDLNMNLFSELSEPEELEAILAWMVEGARKWYGKGLSDISSVTLATEFYKAESDVLGMFLEDRCQVKEGETAPIKEVYEAFRLWAKENGIRQYKDREIRTMMIQKGFAQKRNQRMRYWEGVSVILLPQIMNQDTQGEGNEQTKPSDTIEQ